MLKRHEEAGTLLGTETGRCFGVLPSGGRVLIAPCEDRGLQHRRANGSVPDHLSELNGGLWVLSSKSGPVQE
jgi:hypothetical protein